MNCKFCQIQKFTKNSLAQHEIRCPFNNNRLLSWNTGLTKLTDQRLAKLSIEVSDRQTGKKRPEHSLKLKGRKSSSPGKSLNPIKELERRSKISKSAKARGLGGYIKGSGRGKKGWYKGIFCDSSWELAFVIYHLDHNIEIKRCEEIRYYEWENKQRKYIPDFVINNQIYEIKGYKTEQWNAKISSNPEINVLYENEIKPYIKYVVDKYGKDYINMYE